MINKTCMWAAGVSAFALWHGAGWAQTVAGQATPPVGAAPVADSPPVIAEVIVTAQKRETKLESTPVAVSVVTGAALANRGIYELKDLKAEVPGLNIDEAPGGLPGISIRGIGTTSASQLFEQSVGLFVDGVYNPRSREFTNAIFDVNSIEVIKGSQGVLFGKNTSVGAISVTSNRPTKTFDGYLEGDYETEFGSGIVKGAVDLPVNDKFQIRLAALYDHDGGYVYNATLNREEQKSDRYVLRGMFEFEPTDDLDILLKLQGSNFRGQGDTFEFAPSQPPGLLASLGIADDGDKPYEKYENAGPLGDQFDHQTAFDPALIIKYHLGAGYTLTATTGYSNYKYAYAFDADNTPLPLAENLFFERFSQVSQEIRLSSPIGEHFDYIIGAFYLHQVDLFDYSLRFLHLPLAGLDITGQTDQYLNQDEDDYAGFGQLTWHINDKLNLIVGGRLNQDDKTGHYNKVVASTFGDPTSVLPFLSPPGTTSGKIDDLSFDVTGTLSYAMTNHSVAYVSIGRGTKGGAFNNTALLTASTPTPLTVPAEEAVTYEGGVKGRFLEGRGYAALSLYHLDISNFQDSYYSAVAEGFLIRSIDAQSTGAEFETQYQLTSWLNLYGNAAWTPIAELADGERTERSPKWTGVVGARGDKLISDNVKMSTNLELVHSSSFYNQPSSAPGDNLSGDFDIVNARVAFNILPVNVEVSLTASNLTDARYKEYSFGSVLGIGTVLSYNRPRTLMVGLRKSF